MDAPAKAKKDEKGKSPGADRSDAPYCEFDEFEFLDAEAPESYGKEVPKRGVRGQLIDFGYFNIPTPGPSSTTRPLPSNSGSTVSSFGNNSATGTSESVINSPNFAEAAVDLPIRARASKSSGTPLKITKEKHHSTSGYSSERPTTRTNFRSQTDITMSAGQTSYPSMSHADQEVQNRWARTQIDIAGKCPQGYTWERIDIGYHCRGRHHLITDELLEEGKGGMYHLPGADVNVRTGPWYHVDSYGRLGKGAEELGEILAK